MPKISVLIPAYNVERYLPKCLDSVLSQTFDDFEIILINDGSTDGTGKLCDDYAARDSRIKVYHQSNKGISATRELCLQYASGDYIQFIDSDDWVEPDILEIMYSMAQASNSDVIECSFYLETANASKPFCFNHSKKEDFLNDSIAGKWAVLWRHFFKKTFLVGQGISFPKGIDGGEDYYFVTKSLLLSDRVKSCEKPLYHYNFNNENSFIHRGTFERSFYQYSATTLVENLLRQNNMLRMYEISLNYRKYVVKRDLLKCSIKRSYKYYPDIDLTSIKYSAGVKQKIRFLLSYFLNRLT